MATILSESSKLDIRAAAPHVREAYKAYYKLKTRVLEDLGIILSDESQNDIPSDMTESNGQLIPVMCDKFVEQSNKPKLTRTVLGVINGKEIADSTEDPVSKNHSHLKEDCVKQNMVNENGVWGSHLNRETENPNKKIISLQERSSSSSFVEKLFQGAKFTKRNPRKSLTSIRTNKANKTNTSFSQENPNTSDKTSLSVSLPSFSHSQPLSEEEKNSTHYSPEFSVVKFTDENYKVVQKSTPITNHAMSAIQKSVSLGGQKITNARNIDKGWLERCTKLNFLSDDIHQSVGSTANSMPSCQPRLPSQEPVAVPKEVFQIDDSNSSNSARGNAVQNPVNGITVVTDSDEDVVYSSDSESEANHRTHRTAKRKVSCVEMNALSETRPGKKARLSVSCTPQVGRESSCGSSAVEEFLPVNINEVADQIIEKEKTVTKSAKKTTQKLSQKEILEKKVASGQVNENYVRINLKKKVFVRGKKNTNFSKYKKMQWKKKRNGGGFGPDAPVPGGLLTCFKCGEVGHYARSCMSLEGDKLLPQDNNEEEDESPFPTLEEVALMAAESTIPNRRRPLIAETAMVNTKEESSVIMGRHLPAYVIEALSKDECNNRAVKPLYQLQSDGTPIATPKEVYNALELFGHSEFRPGQEEAVMRILSGVSTLVTLSTGSGKSLCYQLPAYMFSQKCASITLVVSPLVSLMEDQVTGVPSCINAACLHTNQTPKQREKVMEQAKSGNLNILLVSPEAVVSGERNKGFGSILKELPPIAFACIDEVHCVSQWSHNFRPSYLMICQVLRDKLGVTTVLGLTATATKSTCVSIVEHLTIPDGECGVIKDIPMPNNLILSVSKDRRRDDALITLLAGSRFKSCQSIIVYCTRREECERLAVLIRTCLQDFKKPEENKKTHRVLSWNAEPYHAGLTAARRKSVQKAFMSGQLRIVVATVAFGMGINKADIRGVIHYNMPRNFESYVQEVGRAGRDGLPAHCHLFLDSQGNDQNELRRHIHANSVERHVIRKLLQRVFVPCKCLRISEMLEGSELVKEGSQDVVNKPSKMENPDVGDAKNMQSSVKCPGHEVAFTVEETVRALDLPQENISTLLCYLELHPKKWIKVLPSVYTKCVVQSYRGPKALKAAAKMSPPLAMAIALDQRRDISHENSNKIEFPVVDIASALGWDSGMVKSHLKNLEWQKVNDKWRKTGLIVEFSWLGFRVRAPGNLKPSELDEALDSLHERVDSHEQTSLQQLQAVFNALTSVAYSSCLDCSEVAELVRSDKLKAVIREYFEQETLNIDLQLKPLECEEQVAADVRQLVCSYREQTFTGRTVARIFHGIASPCFPPQIWGRTRFWRTHLQEDFKLISKVASREILQLR